MMPPLRLRGKRLLKRDEIALQGGL